MNDWDNGHMDDGWGVAMLFGMLGVGLLIALAVGLAIVWAVRSTRASAPTPPETTGTTTAPPATAGAEQILAERLARGEIETEDYQARLQALRTRGQP